ncbi:MAG: tetratricopeptide repeat protein, partial [Thermoplasmata archaeon]|nr:tetratricopeptide repeat protein [Thermoplasmata archaeon]
ELIAIHMTSKNGPSSKLALSELFKEHHDLNKYLRAEIFSGLSKPEKKLLDMISVFRYPVFSEAFFIDTAIDHECIDALVDKSLLQETTSGYDAHELIREFFYRRLTPHLIAQYHTEAAKYYNSQLEERRLADAGDLIHIAQAALEAQHHHLQAGNYENAAALVVEHAEGLISKGFTEELNSNLTRIQPEVIPENVWAELLIHKGHILTVNGQWDNALSCYQNSLEICDKLGDHCGLARAYNGSGAIYFHKGNLDKAMEFYQKGLECSEAEKDEQNSSKLYSNIALVHWRNGELARAQELMRKSLFLAEKLGDRQGIARSYNNLGIIYWEQQEYDDAIVAYKKSLKLSEILGDKHTITILYNNLGEAYKLKGMVKRAEEFYRKSLELSTELGFKWQIAEVYCNLGELYKGSDPEKSKEYLRAALELYTALGAKREVEKVRQIMKN